MRYRAPAVVVMVALTAGPACWERAKTVQSDATSGFNSIIGSQKGRTMTSAKQIHFYEDDKLVRSVNAADVSDGIRYVEVDGKKVEVAKVVARTSGDTRSIEQYSAEGALLLRTFQVREKMEVQK